MSLTFVTGLFHNESHPSNIKDDKSKYMQNFKHLADTGIPICVYTDKYYCKELTDMANNYMNIQTVKVCASELETFRICEEGEGDGESTILPAYRNTIKDNKFYITLMNAKIELVHDAIQKNPFHTRNFAWIDFGIFKMVQNTALGQNKLTILSKCHFQDKFICFPGCWKKSTPSNASSTDSYFLDNIVWRFCGSFFIGDSQSLTDFYEMNRQGLKEILTLHKKLVWEVNVWDYIERTMEWNPTWYKADNDDTIFDMPSWIHSKCLIQSPNIVKQFVADKQIDEILSVQGEEGEYNRFFTSSTSYVKLRDASGNLEHYINLRCVNYKILENGSYICYDSSGNTHGITNILNKNLLCKINFSRAPLRGDIPELFEIENVVEIAPPSIEEKNGTAYAKGMEDVRIFPTHKGVGFIGSSMNYANSGGTQMFMGEYSEGRMENVRMLQNMKETRVWEKNWIPLPGGRVIYEWGPSFVVGALNEKYEFEPIQVKDTSDESILKKCKGSTLFIPWKHGRYLGVVHYHEGDSPRKYYHCLVELVVDKETGKYYIVRHSIPFYFSLIGIEYCLGFSVWQNNFHFWVSQFDRDPYLMSVPTENIEFV